MKSVYTKCVSRREIRALGPEQRRRIDDRSVGGPNTPIMRTSRRKISWGRTDPPRFVTETRRCWHLLHKALVGDTKIPRCPAVSLGFLFAEKHRDETRGRQGEKKAGHNPSKVTAS